MRRNHNESRTFLTTGKRILTAVIAVSLIIPGTTWAGGTRIFEKNQTVQGTVQMGDVDNNGRVELEDANLTLKAALSITVLSGETKTATDVDFNGQIELSDANLVLKAALGILTLPTPQPVSETPIPSESSTPKPTVESSTTPGYPTYDMPLSLPEVTADPVNVVSGETLYVAKDGLHGADYDYSDSWISFSAQNRGVQLVNPFAGKAELQRTLEEAISLEAEEGKVNCWTLTGASIHLKEVSDGDEDIKLYYYYAPNTVTYTIPEWTNGVTVSFWLKTDVQSASAPVLLFENSDAMLMVQANGSVRYLDGKDAYNNLNNWNSTWNFQHGTFGEWNYYTITIANDWVQVYVNGQENLFSNLTLSRQKIRHFNSGFLTRYNSIGEITEEDVAADKRKYYVRSFEWYWNPEAGRYLYCNDFSVFDNARFRGENADGALIMDLLTGADTKMWIGGTDTSVGTEYTKHSLPAGTEVVGLTAFMKELSPEQIAANYAASQKPDISPFETTAP